LGRKWVKWGDGDEMEEEKDGINIHSTRGPLQLFSGVSAHDAVGYTFFKSSVI